MKIFVNGAVNAMGLYLAVQMSLDFFMRYTSLSRCFLTVVYKVYLTVCLVKEALYIHNKKLSLIKLFSVNLITFCSHKKIKFGDFPFDIALM